MHAALLTAAYMFVWPVTSWSADRITLTFENGPSKQVSLADGVFHLTKGTGWLRIPRILSDFTLSVRFRALTRDTDAGVIIRTWAWDNGWPSRGYRVSLAHAGVTGRELLRGYGAKVKQAAAQSAPEWKAIGEWQTLVVSCAAS
ncbi:MAG TPA: family 16 glycoside hydrolase, partial [Vicinamibacterales bacterium]